MTVTRYEPYGLLNQLQREVNRLFEPGRLGEDEASGMLASDWVPAVDIKEEPGEFVIYADLPGVQAKDIEITMEKGVLTLKGARNAEAKEEERKYKRAERVRGSFLRRFTLPDVVDVEKISAKFKDGVLELVVPKGAAAQPRKITVEG
jgi:HSP20 family protein